jgi:hypothetical protein
MMDLEAARRGEENASTPAEMRALLEAVRAGKGLKPALAKDLLEVAATPKSSPFRRPLPAGLRVADKPGSLEGVRAVAAIVELPRRPYVAAIATTYLKRDQDARKRALADPAGPRPDDDRGRHQRRRQVARARRRCAVQAGATLVARVAEAGAARTLGDCAAGDRRSILIGAWRRSGRRPARARGF